MVMDLAAEQTTERLSAANQMCAFLYSEEVRLEGSLEQTRRWVDLARGGERAMLEFAEELVGHWRDVTQFHSHDDNEVVPFNLKLGIMELYRDHMDRMTGFHPNCPPRDTLEATVDGMTGPVVWSKLEELVKLTVAAVMAILNDMPNRVRRASDTLSRVRAECANLRRQSLEYRQTCPRLFPGLWSRHVFSLLRVDQV